MGDVTCLRSYKARKINEKYRRIARNMNYQQQYKFCSKQGYHVPLDHTCKGCECQKES